MNLDLATLSCVAIVVTVFAATVLSFFGHTQGTYRGFGLWAGAQWMLVAGLGLSAAAARWPFAALPAELALLQWPILVLAGMRRLHMRRRPSIPPAADWAVLALAAGLVFAAAAGIGIPNRITAFTGAALAVHLYAGILLSRFGDFRHSFALKALVAIEIAAAVLEAVCLMFATLDRGMLHDLAAVHAAAQLGLAAAALGLVPIAIALTYERTVAKMRATHRKLRHLADVDVLTRLPNRRHFHDLATRTLATSEPASAALLLFDIEHLKRINDLLGPSTGDEALRQVGLALRETLRGRDVAGRLGGDEFAALLPETTVADAVRVADRITAHLEDRQVAPRTARLTLNVGAVQLRSGDTIVEALRRADVALDDARSHSQGRVSGISSGADTVAATAPAELEPRTV